MVYPGFGLMIGATDNTLGMGDDLDKYAASNVLDTSFLDRWDINVRMDYLSSKDEIKLVRTWVPEIKEPLAKKLVQLADLCRKGFAQGEFPLPMSPRHVRTVAELSYEWQNPVMAIRAVMRDAVPVEYQPTLVTYFNTVGFPTSYGKL